jgi:hypothetical protein
MGRAYRTSRSVGRGRAFSVIEAMLAFIVLLIAILGLIATATVGANTQTGAGGISAIPMAFGDIKQNADEIQASTAAQQYMDSLRYCVNHWGSSWNSATLCPQSAAPTISIDPGYMYFGPAGTAATSPGNFTITGNCSNGGSGPMYTCTVTVTWNEPGTGNTKTVQIVSQADDAFSGS